MLGIVLTMVFIFMLALVIDVALVELYLSNVQAAADSATLAGADMFDVRPRANWPTTAPLETVLLAKEEAWRNAKEAALKALSKSQIAKRFGTQFNVLDATCVEPFTGATSPDISDISHGDWRCRNYDFGELTVKIERGLYYQSGSNLKFLSFEPMMESAGTDVCDELAGDSGRVKTYFFPQRCAGAAVNTDLNSHRPVWIPNALQVTIVLKRLPTFFGRLTAIGLAQFTNISSRKTLAARKVLTVPVGGVDPW